MNFIEKKASNNKNYNNTKSILPKGLQSCRVYGQDYCSIQYSDHMPNVPVKEFIGDT